MEYTDFAGLTVVDQGESPWEDGGSFFGRNPNVIDRLLRRLKTHAHDGAPGLDDPTVAPAVAATSGGGTLPADTPFWIALTLVDDQQGETLPTPAAEITTPIGGDTPTADFTATADYTAGDLPANTYYYVLTATDGMGGETPASDPVTVTLDPGNANGQTLLAGLSAAAGGGTYRLYRSVNGGPFGFLFAGSADTFNDDCSHCADTQLPPPADTDDLTSSTAAITVTVPAIPAGATAWRVYVAPDPSFPSPSFVGEYTAAGDQTITSFGDLLPGQPPVRSTSIGNPAGTGGGGGGGAQPTYIIPPFPGSFEWQLQGADLERAALLWKPPWGPYAYGAAIVARREDVDWSNTDSQFLAWDPTTYPYNATDWQGATAEYTWDPTQFTGTPTDPGGLGGTGAVDTDNLVTRPDTGAAYGDGHWVASFQIDSASWERLMVGARMWGNANEGFLAVLDRAAAKFQIVHFTATAPLTYTVLAEVAVPVASMPAVGQRVSMEVRRFGDDIFAWTDVDTINSSWLTASAVGTPFEGNYGAVGAFGARWSAADALRVITTIVDAPTAVVELVAGGLATTTDADGNPLWYFDANYAQVLWRSDGVAPGLPNNWQSTGTLGLLNGWADLDGDPSFLQWGTRIIWRGRLTNATGWNVGSHILDMGTGTQPYTARSFYVGAEASDGTLGLARIDVLPEDTTTSTPPHMVLAAVDPALTDVGALSLDGVQWEM